MSTTRLEETRKRVQARLTEIGEAADQEVKRTIRIRDAAFAVLGLVGVLFATRRVAKAFAQQSAKKKSKKSSHGPQRNRL